MHRFRVDVLGPTETVSDALERLGALPFDRVGRGCWAWSTDGGWETVADVSRHHPSVPLSVQGFEDFRDEMVHAMVTDGDVTVVGRESVLPSHWGEFHDEDGEPLNPECLAWAGSLIARSSAELEPSSLFCGLETAMVVSLELGRFVTHARDFLEPDAPTESTLEAIVRLARTGLRVSAASASRTHGELSYLLPLRLTQSVVHAGRDEYVDRPGQADWQWWCGILLSSAADLIDDAHMCDVVPVADEDTDGQDPLWRPPGATMELAASALVTSCVQALALFGSSSAGTEEAPRYRSPKR